MFCFCFFFNDSFHEFILLVFVTMHVDVNYICSCCPIQCSECNTRSVNQAHLIFGSTWYSRKMSQLTMILFSIFRLYSILLLPLSTGPPRSSSLRDSSSLKAWFLLRRPGVKPQIGLSTGRATSTSWVISANRITSCTSRANFMCQAKNNFQVHLKKEKTKQIFLKSHRKSVA